MTETAYHEPPTQPATGKIAAALAAFQGEMPTVPKGHTANVKSDKGSYSYTYAGLADVTEAAMPLLSKHGLAFVTLPTRGELVGMLLHESGESLSASLPITGGTPQQIGSSLTYMRRYLFGCMTGLVTDDDDDGQAAQQAGSRRKPARQGSAASDRKAERLPATPPTDPWYDAGKPTQSAQDSPLLNTSGGLAKRMFAALGDVPDVTTDEERLEFCSLLAGRVITTSRELTDADAEAIVQAIDEGATLDELRAASGVPTADPAQPDAAGGGDGS